jgi:hypothetical protein
VKSIVRLNAFSSVLYQTTIVVPAMRTEFKIDRHLSWWQTVGISVVQKIGKTNYMGYSPPPSWRVYCLSSPNATETWPWPTTSDSYLSHLFYGHGHQDPNL